MQAMDATREELYVSLDQPLESSVADCLESLLERRVSREPAAYILGHKEFYGLVFGVSPDVLIPRPETEHVVESVLQALSDKTTSSRPVVLDIGTGSGAIAIAVASKSPQSVVIASDISPAAIKIAHANKSSAPQDTGFWSRWEGTTRNITIGHSHFGHGNYDRFSKTAGGFRESEKFATYFGGEI